MLDMSASSAKTAQPIEMLLESSVDSRGLREHACVRRRPRSHANTHRTAANLSLGRIACIECKDAAAYCYRCAAARASVEQNHELCQNG